mmetsp:Transcript_96405/g.299744  ORF Transcript_96405/g.299744 Transcript_96405/m.299744 type:complete len:222 (-) Transcript_96405:196-861(-)
MPASPQVSPAACGHRATLLESRQLAGARPKSPAGRAASPKVLSAQRPASPKPSGDVPEPQPEPLGRSASRRELGSSGAVLRARDRHEACVEHLRSLAERVDNLEEENFQLRNSEQRLRAQNMELQRQVQLLRVERQRPVERLRGVIDECVRDREVRRTPELRQEAPEQRQVQVRLGGVRRSGASSTADARAPKPAREPAKGLQPRQLRITHRLGAVRRGGA